jgi:dihydrofolate synthase / folylpolyglutamate synthase
MNNQLDQADKKIQLGLERIKIALEQLGNPQDEFSVIHIAGTNGKGSVAGFLELLYLNHRKDLKVAKYTSPHLVSITERVIVNGQNISKARFDELYQQILEISDNGLTEFEKITCVAFLYFKEQKANTVILETGLGGRLDATNICEKKLATIITNIGLDHQEYLGNTIDKIRLEKEGIKRANIPHYEGEEIQAKSFPNSITGQNFLLALRVFEDLNSIKLNESEKQKIIDLFNAQSKARFAFNSDRNILVDGAHNPAAAQVLAKYLKEYHCNSNKTFIIAMLDKDHEAFFRELMPCIDSNKDAIILTSISSSRSWDANLVMSKLRESYPMLRTQVAQNLQESLALSKGFTIITGSLYLAGEYYQIENAM